MRVFSSSIESVIFVCVSVSKRVNHMELHKLDITNVGIAFSWVEIAQQK